MESRGNFQVGKWQVRPQLNEIERDGEIRRLEPRVMDVLAYFAAHAGEVLTKERLIQAVWPDTFVTDDALKYTIVSLRKVLDDNAADPRYVETISKRGYRLAAEVVFPETPNPISQTPFFEPRNLGTAEPSRDRRAALRLLRPEEEPEQERCPYPGLAPFTEQDTALFFGREAEIAALWERIEGRRLLAVIGPSGAGKTSFLQAGVIPARPEGWAAIHATPGSSPALNLVRALTPELAGDAEAMQELLAGVGELTADGQPQRMVAAVEKWRSRHKEALLIFDQFEELFTLNPPEVQAQTAALVEALAFDADLHVVLSMRDDFHFRCSEYPALAPVFDSITPLPLLKHAALRRTLEEPAAWRGYRFEDEVLVEEIVSALEGVRGSLPLLAFAVSRLWEKRDRERKLLTRRAYLEIGGVEGALAGHADATLERIPAEHHDVVREIFRNLVTSQGTRAVIEREELLSVFSDRATAEEVLRLLVNARLLTTYEVEGNDGAEGHHRIEVIHESLLGNWPRLVRWQTQDQEGAQLRDELRQAARTWDQHGRSPDLLWTGTAYQEFSLWRQRYPGALTALEEEYAQSMARRARRRKRLVRFSVAAVILVLVAVAAVIGVSRQQAVEAARRSEASELLAIAQLKLDGDPTEALAYATASLETIDTEAARLFTLRALAESPAAFELEPGNVPSAALFSPDGSRIAAAGFTDKVSVWGADGSLLNSLGGHVTSPRGGVCAVWAGDNLLVTGPCPGVAESVRLWAVPEGREIRTFALGTPSYWQVRKGRLLAESVTLGTNNHEFWDLKMWNLPDGDERFLGRVDWTEVSGGGAFFNSDGTEWIYSRGLQLFSRRLPIDSGVAKLLAALGTRPVFGDGTCPLISFLSEEDGTVHYWSNVAPGPVKIVSIGKPAAAEKGVLIPEPSGRWVWRPPGGDGYVKVWPSESVSGARPLTFRRSGSWYASNCDIHPSGSWMVCSTKALSRLTFWPLPTSLPTVIDGYVMPSRPLAFSPDSHWLATSWQDGGLRLWPVPDSDSREIQKLAAPKDRDWKGLVFDSAGRNLLAVGNGGEAWLVPVDGLPARRLEGYSEEMLLGPAAFSPSGRLAATAPVYGSGDKVLRIWDLQTGAIRVFPIPVPAPSSENGAPPAGYEGGIGSLLFESETVLYSSGAGGILHWDLESGACSVVLEALWANIWPSGRRSTVLVKRGPHPMTGVPARSGIELIDLATGEAKPVPEFDEFQDLRSVSRDGSLIAGASPGGSVYVGRADGASPHILAGHRDLAQYVAISPDLKWVASTGEDNTLRLWPMPDLSKPPLHTLPHDELIAKLKSLTNLRAIPDPAAENGWKIELDRFPGWKEVPTW